MGILRWRSAAAAAAAARTLAAPAASCPRLGLRRLAATTRRALFGLGRRRHVSVWINARRLPKCALLRDRRHMHTVTKQTQKAGTINVSPFWLGARCGGTNHRRSVVEDSVVGGWERQKVIFGRAQAVGNSLARASVGRQLALHQSPHTPPPIATPACDESCLLEASWLGHSGRPPHHHQCGGGWGARPPSAECAVIRTGGPRCRCRHL